MSKQNISTEMNGNSQPTIIDGRYEIQKKIGQGNYGEVWLVTPRRSLVSNKSSQKQYVLKRLNLRSSTGNSSQNDIKTAERESQLLSKLKHPNIVTYIDSFLSADGFLNIVMSYCEGGDLYNRLKDKKSKKESLSEDQIIEWFIQICLALLVRNLLRSAKMKSRFFFRLSTCTRTVFFIEI